MNRNKQWLCSLLALILLVSTAVIGAPAAHAAAAEQADADQQLDYMQSQISKLIQKNNRITWYYTVTDLDHDGNLEFVAAAQHPEDRSTNLKVWEVSADGSSLTECRLDKDEDESFPDILTDCADTFHDPETDTWSYLLYDNIILSDKEVYTVQTGVSLKDGVIGYAPYAIEHTVAENSWRNVSYIDANGFEISQAEYSAAGTNAFAGADRSSTSFEWLTESEAKDLSRLSDSYAVFMGRKAPTEVFPVPKPAILQDAAATPIPAVSPVPVQDTAPTYLSVTKNPTNENKKAGNTALFVACANAYDSLTWTFVSPNGGEYSVPNFRSYFGAAVTGEYSTTLGVENVTADMNGWGAYCTFYYRGQTARTSTAYMYVSEASPAPDPKSGVSYGSVFDIKNTYVTIQLNEGFSVVAEWSVIDLSGDIYSGAPATVYWDGSKDNVVYCVIQGSQPAPQPQYGSMSGIAHEGGGGYAIDLANGTQVYVDAWKCSVTGNFYDGATCVVYYTDSPSGDNIYQADIFGADVPIEYSYGETYTYELQEAYNEDGSTYDTLTCPNCGAEVSLTEDVCPNCGFEIWA